MMTQLNAAIDSLLKPHSPICHWVITISSCKLPTQRRFKTQLSTHWGFKQFEPFHSRLIPFIVSLHPVSQGL